MKRFLVFWIDKFGLEWSETVLGYSRDDVISTYSYNNPGSYDVRAYQLH